MYLINPNTIIEPYLSDVYCAGLSNSLPISTSDKIVLYGKFKDIGELLFLTTTFSIISGEYIRSDDFIKKIDDFNFEFRDTLNKKTQSFLTEDTEFLTLIKFSDYIIKLYRRTIENILNTINDPEFLENTELNVRGKHWIISEHSVNNTDFSRLADFFSGVVELTILDHKLSVDKQTIKKLLKIYDLYKNEDFELVKFFKEKCIFLIKKIYLSISEDEKKEKYSFNVSDERLEDIIENFKFTILKEHDDVCAIHTEVHIQGIKKSNKLKKRYMEVISNANVNLNTKDYFTLIKYYKETNENVSQIKNLISSFQSFSMSGLLESSFDKRAAYTIENYLYNNELSLRIKTNNFSYKDIDSEIEKIETLQEKVKVYNYFPYYKLATFVCGLLDKESRDELPNLAFFNDLLKKLDKIIILLISSFKWCRAVKFIPYQTTYNDSCVKVKILNIGEIDCFFASSFILPINYSEERGRIDNIVSQKEKFHFIYDILEIHQKNKGEIVEIRQQVENAEKKNIEVLSIFAAIALFAIGNIQIFSKISTLHAGIIFMLSFGYCLTIFVLLIWFVTRDRAFKTNQLTMLHWFTIILLLISTVIAFVYLFYGNDIPLIVDDGK